MLDSTKIFIVDFEDSFTFNIATVLFSFEKEIKVMGHQEFFQIKNLDNLLKTNKSIGVILGPGPGSPEIYKNYFSKISDLRNNSHIYLMGICLGHQILALIDGLIVKPSLTPVHGEQVLINFENINIHVQRYNSLAVYNTLFSSNEIYVRNWERGVSYQFHPESIGTNKNSLFFRDLLNFIK